jgi:hypothetical protein
LGLTRYGSTKAQMATPKPLHMIQSPSVAFLTEEAGSSVAIGHTTPPTVAGKATAQRAIKTICALRAFEEATLPRMPMRKRSPDRMMVPILIASVLL